MREPSPIVAMLARSEVRIAFASAALGVTMLEYGSREGPEGWLSRPAAYGGIALAMIGIAVLLRAGREATGGGVPFGPGHWLAAILVSAGVALRPLGFPLVTAVVVVAVLRLGGSRALLRDVAIGFGLAAASYLLLAKGLGVPLAVGSVMKLFYPA